MNRSWLISLVLVFAFVLGLCVYFAETSFSTDPFEGDYTRPTETLSATATPSLEGKTVLNFGDSIFGNFREPSDISSFVSESTNATVYNVAFGGCRMSTHVDEHYNAFSMHMLADAIAQNDWTLQDTMMARNDWKPTSRYVEHLQSLKSINFSKVDIITIAYGTNDFTAKTVLDNPADPYDITTFAGALRYSIETISNAYPQIQIVVCTPIYRFWVDKNNDYTFLYDSETYVLENKKLTDFVQTAKEVAAEYDLLCIDNYANSGICAETRTECFGQTDGTHPNSTGRKKIADHMAQVLLAQFA